MASRRHRLAALAAALLVLTVSPALTLMLAGGDGCGCSGAHGPCSCCKPSEPDSSHGHSAMAGNGAGAAGSGSSPVTGRCHLRRGNCETSAPQTAVLTTDTGATGILQSGGETGSEGVSPLSSPAEPQAGDSLAKGPEPPPPRRVV